MRRTTAGGIALAAALAALDASGGAEGRQIAPERPAPELERVLNAVRDGEFETVLAALDAGFPVDRKAPNGMTALHVAAVLGRERLVDLLLERGAEVDDPAQNGITPLNRAAMGGHLGTMERLLAAGADPDAAGTWGATPLLSAVDRGRLDAARLLLAAGADPTRAARNGETAVSLARRKGHAEILALLSADPETLAAAGAAATDRRTERARTHFRTGVAFEDAGETRRAVSSYRLGLEEQPDDPEIRYRLGRALHRFGEREALLHLREAVLGWEAAVESGEPLPPVTRPALQDACEILRSAERAEDAARCEAVLSALEPS